MRDDLTNSQIALLCAIEKHDESRASSDQRRDLELLISKGYVQPTADPPGSAFSSRPRAPRLSARAAPG